MVSGGTMHTHETTVDDCRPTFQFFIFPLFTSVLSLSLSGRIGFTFVLSVDLSPLSFGPLLLVHSLVDS